MSEIEFLNDPEFKVLEDQGFISDYIMIKGKNPRTVHPIVTLEEAIERGFFPKGTKVKWVDHNGWDFERLWARDLIGTERVLTVEQCRIGQSSSKYKFNEIDGEWNSVMFEKVS